MRQDEKASSLSAPVESERDTFHREVLEGLLKTQKELPAKYLYDERGSRLFEDICQTEAYYLTRTELQIMQERASEMALLLGPNCLLIEYGSGNCRKVRVLLDVILDSAV